MEKNLWDIANQNEFVCRMDQQFHWQNAAYSNFDDFLGDLASKKRKNLRRERKEAIANDIEIEHITGASLSEEHWDAFFAFYLDTGQRKWGTPYLTRSFFSEIQNTMAEETLLIMAKRNGRYIAGALNFIGENTLFGRNWGCIEDHRFLHFEICYYQAIDFAIANGLKTVEAGAQGSHKVARGYLPCATYSAHWIENDSFRDAISKFVDEEKTYVERDINYIEQHSPFNSNVGLRDLREIQVKET
jgi:predicted N-acyltransferase